MSKLQVLSEQFINYFKTGLSRCQKSGYSNRADKSFQEFLVDLPKDDSVDDYDALIYWCEGFSAFTTSARLS